VSRLATLLCLGTSLFCILGAPAQGGNDEWTGGGPWTNRGLKTFGVNSLHPDTFYAFGYNNPDEGDSLVYLSTDGGETWASLWQGVDNTIRAVAYYGKAVAIHPVAPETVYALIRSTARDTFMFVRSNDHGMTWKAAHARMIEDKVCEFIAIDPVEPNRIYLSGENVPCHYSTDGGRAWHDSETPFAGPVRTFGFAINPLNNAVIYSGADTTVIKSTDYGVNWDELPSGSSYMWGGMIQVQMSPDDTCTITVESGHSIYKDLWRSTDCGLTWKEVDRFQRDHGGAWFFQIDPYDGDHMFVAAGDTFIYWTIDGGGEWWVMPPGKLVDRPTGPMILSITNDLYNQLSIIIESKTWIYTITDTIAPTFFYATEYMDTTYWGPYPITASVVDTFNETVGKNYGIRDSSVVLHWQYHDLVEDTLSPWVGVPMTYDASEEEWWGTIPPVSYPYHDCGVHYFVSACDTMLNCSAWPEGADTSGGYWEFTYTYSGVEELPGRRDGSTFFLHPVAPNPAQGPVTVRYSLAEQSPVRMLIYNIAGQVVRMLVDEPLGPGRYQTVWDGTDNTGREVPSGVYFCELRASGLRSTRKVMLLR
jgi:photosystem II stability/assembly factor-like uncharacterized protein